MKKTKKPTKPKVNRKKKINPNKPGSGLIVVESPVLPGSRVVVASELMDDLMLEKEMSGAALPYYIYQFCDDRPRCYPPKVCPPDHKKIAGLSSKGVHEVVRRANSNPKSGMKIRINPSFMTIERDVTQNNVKGLSVSVYAEDLVTGNSSWGTKFEPYVKNKRDGGTYPNDFALEKATSKAERNAKRHLIPEVVAVKIIQHMLKYEPDRVQQITPPETKVETRQLSTPVPSTPAEAEAIVRNWVNSTNTSSRLLEGLRKLENNKDYSPAFRKEISTSISTKVDRLDNPK